jgi:hypothetical protein
MNKIDNQIKEKIDGIYPLIAEIDFNVNTLVQFYEELSSDELLVFDKYILLQVLRHYLWNSSILDLCKLYIDNEKYSFNCLLNILINNHSRVSFKNPLSLDEIQNMADKIKKFDGYIVKIKDVRDSNIAHKDNKTNYGAVMLHHLKALVTLAKEIFNTLYEDLYDSTFIWLLKEDERAISLISNIAKYEAIRKYVFNADFLREGTIPTSKLIRFIDKNYLRE